MQVGDGMRGAILRQRQARDHILLEAWPDRGAWAAIHTGDSLYIETVDDLTEFYDLTRDPFQMENAVNDPQYRDVIAQLKQYLDAERPSGALSP